MGKVQFENQFGKRLVQFALGKLVMVVLELQTNEIIWILKNFLEELSKDVVGNARFFEQGEVLFQRGSVCLPIILDGFQSE